MNIKDIKGLTPDGAAAVSQMFVEHTGILPQPNYHRTLEGCWFQVYNPILGGAMVIHGDTTMIELLEVLHIS